MTNTSTKRVKYFAEFLNDHDVIPIMVYAVYPDKSYYWVTYDWTDSAISSNPIEWFNKSSCHCPLDKEQVVSLGITPHQRDYATTN